MYKLVEVSRNTWPAGLETLVLVETARGDKQPAPPSAALRTAAEQRLALGGLVAAAPVEAAPEPPEPPEPTTPPRKPRPQPPSTPPKLAFGGHETLGELVTLLSRGSAQAQAKAAAQLAAQAAAGAGESERLVAAGALPPNAHLPKRSLVARLQKPLSKTWKPLSGPQKPLCRPERT